MPTHHEADEDEFFTKRTFSSAKKSAILERFFKGWAAVLQSHSQRLLYIDLFAGPGTYDEDEYGNVGSSDNQIYSTPLRILKAAATDTRFAKALVSIFNDGNPIYVERLRAAVAALPERSALKYDPQFFCDMVSDQIAGAFNGVRMAPAILFVDPFGYKGLTRRLIGSVLKDWGSDCVFFFNYNRVNQALGQDQFDAHLYGIFGKERTEQMRGEVRNIRDPFKREEYILKKVFEAMAEIGGKYAISYRFRKPDGRTRQHIVFTSKNLRGYDVMKKSMASESFETADGVPTYEFVEPGEPTLFQEVLPPRAFPWTIDRLADDLKKRYARTEKSFKEIFQEDYVSTPYVEKNYRAAILALQKRGAVALSKPDGSAVRTGSCPLDTLVKFGY